MAQWLETPAIVLAVLAALTILWKAAHWKGTVDEHRTTVTSFMKEIRDKIDRIFERLPPVPVKRGSPLRLTDFGAQISEWLGADAWATDLAPKLRGQVEEKAPFEIDRFSREYVRGDEIGPEWARRVAACAYEFGTDESGVFDVLQVVLRDKLLALLGHEPPDAPATRAGSGDSPAAPPPRR